MPKRIEPKYYETPPSFYPEGGEVWAGVDDSGRARDAAGRFAFTQPKTLEPTPTIAPTKEEKRPRSLRASYDPADRTLRIQFRNGRVYGYYDVDPTVWRQLRNTASTGRFINRRLDPFFEYGEEWPYDA